MLPRLALADDLNARPISRSGSYSAFEVRTIDRVLKERKLELEPNPEGKRIEKVEIYTIDIFEKDDLDFLKKVPLASPLTPIAVPVLNGIHWKSEDFVIERALLQNVGDPYDHVIGDELARNLRRLANFSLVVVVPVKGNTEDSIRLLVITRDIWSLRLNITTFTVTSSGGIEQFSASPGEQNFLGAHQQVRANISILPGTTSIGAEYINPRAFSTWIGVGAAASLQFNTKTGTLEGSSGSAQAGQPLYTTRTKWAWNSSVAWSDVVVRRFLRGEVALFNARSTPERDLIPDMYRNNAYRYSLAVTRSFGWQQKINVLFGGEVNLKDARLEGVEGYDPIGVAEFKRRRLPVGERRVGPFAGISSYSNDYMRIINHETLGLQEDVRLGQDLSLRAYPVLSALGSSRDFLGMSASAQYTFPLGKDGLLRVSAESTVETNGVHVSDGSIGPDFRFSSPSTPIGRFIVDGGFFYRFANSRNRFSSVGPRLRGYPTGTFIGRDLVYGTTEFRSKPVRLASIQLGAAAFYDASDAPDDLFRNPHLHHDAGFGLRALVPQFERIVYRLDFAVPLERPLPVGVPSFAVTFAFGQAFDFDSASTVSTGYLNQ